MQGGNSRSIRRPVVLSISHKERDVHRKHVIYGLSLVLLLGTQTGCTYARVWSSGVLAGIASRVAKALGDFLMLPPAM